MIVLDSHCDSPSQMFRLRDFGLDNVWGQVDFPKMKRGGVDASFFALYTSNELSDSQAYALAMRMLGMLEGQVAANPDKVAFARSSADVCRNKEKGLISIMIGMENGTPLMERLDRLEYFHNRGVLYLTLTHNGDNFICDSCAGNHKWGGLSPFGKDVVAEMNRLGMIIDIAHCADDTVWDCLKYSTKPIVSTHSCCRALCNHRRNLTDEQIKAIADKGGVVQINFYPAFLSEKFNAVLKDSRLEELDYMDDEFREDPGNPEKEKAWVELQERLKALWRPSAIEIVDHIDHVVKIAGIGAVGIGTDFDGISVPPQGLEDVSKLPVLFDEMKHRGYSDSDIEKVAGANFLRVLDDNQR